MKDLQHFDLSGHNTFGISAHCDRFVELDTADEASRFFQQLSSVERQKLLLIGGGSNLLLTRDFDGVVVRSAIKGIEVSAREDDVLLTCGSGEVWDDLVAYSVEHGWYGAENLSLIPGDVGATAVQNIGAYGAEVGDLIHGIEAVDTRSGEQVSIRPEECHYGYRDSRFKHEWRQRYFITQVTYKLSTTFCPNLDYGNLRGRLSSAGIPHPTAQDVRRAVIEVRQEKLPDPKTEGNAGSFFINPVVSKEKYLQLAADYPDMPHYTIDESHEKIPAGWMIERCGWKGRSLGRAGVHDRQALVLVNKGGATGAEVLRLCENIRHDVLRVFGIEITPEVNII